jgi:general secretion pathway protein C
MFTAKMHSPVSPKALYTVTFCVWALVLYSAVYWGFKWLGRAENEVPVSSVGTQTLETTAVTEGELQSALGVQSMPALKPLSAQEMQAQQLSLLNSRVRLMGVVATQSPSSNSTGSPRGIQSGVALLSLDQQAPKPFKVGDEVEAGLFLLSLAPKSVSLGPSREGPATLTLLLPEPKGL